MEGDRYMEGESYDGLAARAVRQYELIQALQKRIAELESASASLREEAVRQHNRADEEYRSWLRVHDAMNLLRQDAMRVMQENGVASVYRELEAARAERDRLIERRQNVRRLTRTIANAVAEMRQSLEEKDEALEDLRRKVTEVETQRDLALETAKKVIDAKDAQLIRIKEYTARWHRGELGALEAVAGIGAEFDGYPLPTAHALDRARASRAAEAASLLNEATDQLAAIEALLEAEGVGFVNTHVRQVKDYIHLQKVRDDV
jgi:chromosome segregation ATPase